MEEIAGSAAKLLLAVAAFVLVGWFGARDKRIGGVLLTFPLLNGIAMLTGVDPLGVARTVYVVVIWNAAFFLVVIQCHDRLPPLPAGLDRELTILCRALVWAALWASGAVALALLRDELPSAPWLFALQLALAAIYLAVAWRPAAAPSSVSFATMWLNTRGGIRVACFVAVFAMLSAVAQATQSPRWVGWASALPLPGIFALATLAATQTRDEMASLRDTVLLGPLLVIPFNALLARAIVHLRGAGAGPLAESVTVVLFWAVAAALVFVALPPLVRWRDRATASAEDLAARR
jgi:uncharacterized membrane protein (GlpM family)